MRNLYIICVFMYACMYVCYVYACIHSWCATCYMRNLYINVYVMYVLHSNICICLRMGVCVYVCMYVCMYSYQDSEADDATVMRMSTYTAGVFLLICVRYA
jgi:hypothetical protein